MQTRVPIVFDDAPGGGGATTATTATDIAALGYTVTGYTGGGATNLDGVPTTSLAVNRLFYFGHATDGLKFYWLRAGTTAESSPTTIRPDDYNGATNAKIWKEAI